MKKNLQTYVVIALVLLLLLGGGAGLQFASQDLGYSTAFQGPKARFIGARISNQPYTSTDPQGASQSAFDTTMNFDVDAWDSGKPNIIGEMTSIFVPKEQSQYSFLANHLPTTEASADWANSLEYIENPQPGSPYSWNISGKTYKMEQWLLKWFVSFKATWDDSPNVGWSERPYPGGGLNAPSRQRNNYVSTQIWFEIDISDTWYIQGSGGTAHFAIGSILVSAEKKFAVDNDGKNVNFETDLSYAPTTSGDLYMYKGLFGGEQAETSNVQTYQDKELNPKYFRDKIYCHFDLNNFGVTGWNEGYTQKAKGDVVTIAFDVRVFVIGEWTVKDIQKIPSNFGFTAQTDQPASILDFLKDPRIQALIPILIIIAIVVLLAIFAPWVLLAIFSMFTGRKRR